MKKIGFIDYYLDEWHANNYPGFIKDKAGDEFTVAYAYGKIDSPIGGMTSREWADKYNIELLDTIEELTEKSDYIIVLSPNNPEMHEELSELPLKSGKLTYIDKTFAPDKDTAKRIFEIADKYGTKCYSCSALRFSTELHEFSLEGIETIVSQGPGTFEMYSIHQIEPIVYLMNTPAKRVMCINNGQYPSIVIEFADGRIAQMSQMGWETSFSLNAGYKNGKADYKKVESDYFGLFTHGMLEFFRTGEVKVPHEQTAQVIAIREAGIKGLKEPFKWIEI